MYIYVYIHVYMYIYIHIQQVHMCYTCATYVRVLCVYVCIGTYVRVFCVCVCRMFCMRIQLHDN